MTDNTKKELEAINTAAYKLADEKLQQVADDVKQELKSYAMSHKRTGLLNKNIKLTRKEYKDRPGRFYYIIDGGERSNYGGKSYHPITFFKHESGKRKLTETLRKARENIK